ncbi:unnamed protein product [Dibothriocephalus latus]|uniref:Uncharacterized protein n=1 Tax=Dibothriocephalus latus TaxID=60516 RepID=A0A3P6P0J1_DIBLA|nr:unnamed protein product [Dibothriocephalus latus]
MRRHDKIPIGTSPNPDARFSRAYIRIVGPDCSYLLIHADRFIWGPEANPMPDVKAFLSSWVFPLWRLLRPAPGTCN